MLIACKCLNFMGSTGQIDQKLIQSNKDESTRNDPNSLPNILASELKRQQISRRINFNCLEFLRQAIGPISDLTTTINQNDLIYKVPLDSWLLYYCINCNKITHGKSKSNQTYLINSKLLTNKTDINSLKTSKSFSTTFNILMIDHQPTTPIQINDLQFGFNSTSINQQQQLIATSTTNNENIFNFQHSNSNNSIISSTSVNEYNNTTSIKIQQQKRLRNLNQMLQQRLQKEIRDTDERIRRYSEQQFALLKNFREKSEQEYQMLVSLVNQVPDELKVIDAIDDNINNTITPTTSTTMKTNDNTDSNNSTIFNMTNRNPTILTTTTKTKGAIDNTRQVNEQQQPPSLLVFNKSLNQNQQQSQQQSQIPNIETPPGTPENIPMSVGNSPTFRPQQQQQHQQQNNNGGQQGPNTILNNTNDDCLFELDDFEVYQGTDQFQNMSDVEECEDAADALGELTTGINIPKNMGRRGSNSIAKSLPIKIANMGSSATKYDFQDLDDEAADDTVDIAASIKALAKSVHGNAVFGELPRPRFSTQI